MRQEAGGIHNLPRKHADAKGRNGAGSCKGYLRKQEMGQDRYSLDLNILGQDLNLKRFIILDGS